MKFSSFCFTSVTLRHVQTTNIHDTSLRVHLISFVCLLLYWIIQIPFFVSHISSFSFLYTCFTSVFDDILHFIRKGKKKCILNVDERSALLQILFLVLCCICDDHHHRHHHHDPYHSLWHSQHPTKYGVFFASNQFMSVATNAWKYNVNMILVNSNVSLSTT